MTNKEPLSHEQRPHLSRVLVTLWPQLTQFEQEQLMLWTDCYAYEAGEIIYLHSDRPDCVYILAEGLVKVTEQAIRTQTMRMVGPTDFFGYSNFFADAPSSMCAIAIAPSLVYHFPIHGLECLIHANQSVAMYFIRDLSSLLLRSYDMTLSLTQKHVRGRLADVLLSLEEKFGTRDQESELPCIQICRADLSDLCNMTVNNVTRTLKSLEADHILRLDGKKIIISNIAELKEVSDLG